MSPQLLKKETKEANDKLTIDSPHTNKTKPKP